MANPYVTEAMVRGFAASMATPFAERLLDALDAGVAAGGGTHSAMAAAVLIVDRHAWPLVDLRVDFEGEARNEAAQPVAGLRAARRSLRHAGFRAGPAETADQLRAAGLEFAWEKWKPVFPKRQTKTKRPSV